MWSFNSKMPSLCSFTNRILPEELNWLTSYDSHMWLSSILAREHIPHSISSLGYLLLWCWHWKILDVVLITGTMRLVLDWGGWLPVRTCVPVISACTCNVYMYICLFKYSVCIHSWMFSNITLYDRIFDSLCISWLMENQCGTRDYGPDLLRSQIMSTITCSILKIDLKKSVFL